MSNTSEFLYRAEKFADTRGGYDLFVEKYGLYRETAGVRDSTWLAIKSLYGEECADLLEQSPFKEA